MSHRLPREQLVVDGHCWCACHDTALAERYTRDAANGLHFRRTRPTGAGEISVDVTDVTAAVLACSYCRDNHADALLVDHDAQDRDRARQTPYVDPPPSELQCDGDGPE